MRTGWPWLGLRVSPRGPMSIPSNTTLGLTPTAVLFLLPDQAHTLLVTSREPLTKHRDVHCNPFLTVSPLTFSTMKNVLRSVGGEKIKTQRGAQTRQRSHCGRVAGVKTELPCQTQNPTLLTVHCTAPSN